jgi:hypothetical protein
MPGNRHVWFGSRGMGKHAACKSRRCALSLLHQREDDDIDEGRSCHGPCLFVPCKSNGVPTQFSGSAKEQGSAEGFIEPMINDLKVMGVHIPGERNGLG